MADKRKDNGGHSNGGRKSKADEQKLIEKLSPLMPKAYIALKNALEDNESWAVKLAMEYFYGKPRQQMDITTNDESLNKEMTVKDAAVIAKALQKEY